LAALVQVCATLRKTILPLEYPIAKPEWWYDIIEGLPNPMVKDGLIEVRDSSGWAWILSKRKPVNILRLTIKTFSIGFQFHISI